MDEVEGLQEPSCNHLVAVVDWVGDLVLNDAFDEQLADRLQEAFDEASDGDAAVAAILPPTVIGFVLREPARGGGHTGSGITLFVDVQGEAPADD